VRLDPLPSAPRARARASSWNFAPSEGALFFHDTRTGRRTNVSALTEAMGAHLVAFEHDPADRFGSLRACWQRSSA
jgi:hypothetical protein